MFVQSKVRLKYILITCDLFWGRIPLPSLQGRDLAGIYLPRALESEEIELNLASVIEWAIAIEFEDKR